MKLPTYDPFSEIEATAEQINTIRHKLERKPVTINGRPYDCSYEDLLRMEAVGLASPNKDITWTLADNTEHVVRGALLLNIRDDIIAELGKRFEQLHAISQDFKRRSVTLRDIQAEQWIAKYKTE